MMNFKSANNNFSSVAANVATASSCANNSVILGAALAVPFFVALSLICIIMNIAIISIIAIILTALIIIKNSICISKSERCVNTV